MVFPYAAVIATLNMQRRQREEEERKRKALEENKKKEISELKTKESIVEPEKEVLVDRNVEEILVTYDDGTKRTLQRGLALDLLSAEQAMLDCKNLKDEDILTFIDVLISVGKEKGLFKD